ncbi:MAG TPA: aminopeptidase P family protein [Candidatus Polarisedimenticolia bacterium]|nr:aminopeptidase P family protein [Candidatus Polarisedimenticolia bacterium]
MAEPSGPPAGRLKKARAALEEAGLDALVVTSAENVRYLSGFTGSSAALAVPAAPAGDPWLVTDGRYAEQAGSEAPGFRVRIVAGAPGAAAARLAAGARVGFEAACVTWDLWQEMREALKDAGGPVLIPCRNLIEALRTRKDERELEVMERAAAIASGALEEALPLVRPGTSERDIALRIEQAMHRRGAEGPAFASIVASGPRAALPHGRASGRLLGEQELVVIDIGARFEGYHSDMTRTFFTGRPGAEARRVRETVREAQQRAIEAVRPGVAARDVDRAARQVIEDAGFAERFGHGTGHGVGLQVHEAPRVGARSEEVLEAGMVITVEPGIYLQGEGGVRIEDMVLVTGTGARVLTPASGETWCLE